MLEGDDLTPVQTWGQFPIYANKFMSPSPML